MLIGWNSDGILKLDLGFSFLSKTLPFSNLYRCSKFKTALHAQENSIIYNKTTMEQKPLYEAANTIFFWCLFNKEGFHLLFLIFLPSSSFSKLFQNSPSLLNLLLILHLLHYVTVQSLLQVYWFYNFCTPSFFYRL